MTSIFYVYEHWRPDTDKPFYEQIGRERLGQKRNTKQHALNDQNVCGEIRNIVNEPWRRREHHIFYPIKVLHDILAAQEGLRLFTEEMEALRDWK